MDDLGGNARGDLVAHLKLTCAGERNLHYLEHHIIEVTHGDEPGGEAFEDL